MPVSYKRKNTMKKSKSSKGSKSSKLSKRVKTRKSTKTKKRLTRKSKNGSVVRKMRGGGDKRDEIIIKLNYMKDNYFKINSLSNGKLPDFNYITINAEINNEINEVNKRPKYELNTNNKQKKTEERYKYYVHKYIELLESNLKKEIDEKTSIFEKTKHDALLKFDREYHTQYLHNTLPGRLATKHTKNTQNAQVDKNENKIKAQIEAEETKKEEIHLDKMKDKSNTNLYRKQYIADIEKIMNLQDKIYNKEPTHKYGFDAMKWYLYSDVTKKDKMDQLEIDAYNIEKK